MPKNTPIDLNNMLYEQLERINDESLTDEGLRAEIDRSKAMTGLASQIVANNQTTIAALRLSMQAQRMEVPLKLPSALTRGEGDA